MLLCQRVNAVPPANGCIVVPRAMVVPVQPELAVQFLSVVLEALHVAVGALCEQGTVRLVVIDLLHASALGNYHSVVALMVLQVEMVGGTPVPLRVKYPLSVRAIDRLLLANMYPFT